MTDDTDVEPGPNDRAAKRRSTAEVGAIVAAMACEHCATVGRLKVASTPDRTRYLLCRACGKRSKMVYEEGRP